MSLFPDRTSCLLALLSISASLMERDVKELTVDTGWTKTQIGSLNAFIGVLMDKSMKTYLAGRVADVTIQRIFKKGHMDA